MKKLVLFAVAVVAISFASCGNKANTDAAGNADSTVVATEATTVEEVIPADSTATVPADSTATEAAPAE